jgi:pimeloyl-ACP methyl ester carboxylesterase
MIRTSAQRRANVQEPLGMAPGAATARVEATTLGSTPLLVLTSSELGPGMSDAVVAKRRKYYPSWLQMQREYPELSTRSHQVIADFAGHHLQLDDPDLVVRELRAFLDHVAENLRRAGG